MKSNLTKKDYVNILKFYKLSIPKTKKSLQHAAEKILAEKLCKCIKKVGPEKRSIGICTNTIFTPKGLTRGRFKCRGTRKVNVNKLHK
jgi:hypothetical protein